MVSELSFCIIFGIRALSRVSDLLACFECLSFLLCLLEVDSPGRPVLGTKRGANLLFPFHGVFLGRVGDPLGYNFVAGIINGEDNLVAARNCPVV